SPPYATTAGCVPTPSHISEDGLGGVEVSGVAGQIVGFDPSQGPPALVIVVFVHDEVGAAMRVVEVLYIAEVGARAGLLHIVNGGAQGVGRLLPAGRGVGIGVKPGM